MRVCERESERTRDRRSEGARKKGIDVFVYIYYMCSQSVYICMYVR